MAAWLHVRLDGPTEKALRHHMAAGKLTRSQAVRDLLRHALGTVSGEREAGWHEGLMAGKAEYMKQIGRTAHALQPKGE